VESVGVTPIPRIWGWMNLWFQCGRCYSAKIPRSVCYVWRWTGKISKVYVDEQEGFKDREDPKLIYGPIEDDYEPDSEDGDTEVISREEKHEEKGGNVGGKKLDIKER
jgi:hypothetical protein